VAMLSPDGNWVAFVRNNDLYVTDTASGSERRLTDDGAGKILNGVLDWVYEEEIYGRGQRRAFWWSPDSSRLAFLRTDDTPVPAYVVVDDIPYDQSVERWDYPQAGDPNPVVTLGIAHVENDEVDWVDLSAYAPDDRLVTGVAWTGNGADLLYLIQNRIQNSLDVNLLDTASGRTRQLLRETSRTWVSNPDLGDVQRLADGSVLWLSEQSGWRHIYRYDSEGTLLGRVTKGDWDVRSVYGVDEDEGWIYFSATERSYVGQDIYRIRVDGSGQQRLSSAAGNHSARFSPGFERYLDSWSDVVTPPRIRLHRNDGSLERVVAENEVRALADFELSTPEFLQVKSRDGFEMEAMMIKPPDFDPQRKYPVYQFTYAGPQAPQVRNAWVGSQYMYHQLLAQKGIIVWMCDNRTASAKGVQSAWPVYRNFGELELRDIEDCLGWLKSQPYVDAERIGIHGWSYGGYMTSYALTHSRSFVMGIAGGTVSDWRSYDSIYTERYMGLPSDNEEGYRRSAPRWAARDLHGALMLIHGAIDENVHPANTMQFAHELQKAQKPFELMLYPQSRHGITDPQLARHLRMMMLAFTERHLLDDGSSAPRDDGAGR
ncbi:MAG: S9 family peptidase, partial [Vicinamibacterales bacterium]